MVSGRDAPGRASHVKSSSYCDSVHTLMLFSPPSGTIPLEEVESAESSPKQQQSNSGSSTPRSRTTKPGPLKILVRAFNACRRVRGMRSKETVLPPTPRPTSPATPTMSAHEAAAIRRLLAVPPRHSLTFASNWSSSTTSLGIPSDPSPTTWPSVSSRSSSSTYYTAASSMESPYPSLRRVQTAQAQHPYALAAPVYE
ncbi:hypothetical protein FS837_002532 [Tulasnella sp. UAMH 9824]|nr:hypothetical protein FS837_002532 [Tulasnella sp. UAMH 9824]